MAKIRNIFFDMGDTLVHRPIDRQIGFAMLLRKFGYDVSNEALLEAYDKARPMLPPETQYKQDMDEVNTRFMIKIKATIANLGLSPVDEIARRLVESDFNPIQLFPDVLPMLREVKALGFRLGIISNWDPALIKFCEKIGIRQYFDAIIASRALGHRKPEPEIFICALAAIGGEAEESVHVGDSPGSDAVGAMGVGMQSIVIDREGAYRGHFFPAIRSFDELTATMDSLPR